MPDALGGRPTRPKKAKKATKAQQLTKAEKLEIAATEASEEALNEILAPVDIDLNDEDLARIRPNMGQDDTSLQYDSVLLSDLLPPFPDRGDFDVKNVADSTYFFS